MSGAGIFWIVVAIVAISLVVLRIIPRYYDTEDQTFYVGATVYGLAFGVITLVVLLAWGDDLQRWFARQLDSTYLEQHGVLRAAIIWVPTICFGVIAYDRRKRADKAAESAA